MTLAEILTELIARGVRPDIIAEISCVFSEKGFADRVRAQTKARVRNYRERVTLRNGTVTLPNGHIEDSLLSSKSPKKERKKDISRKHGLPDDFTLSLHDHNFAESHGWNAARRSAELARMVDHAKSTGRKLIDWHAGWRTWVTSPYNGGNGNGHRKTTREVGEELIAELRARENAANGSSGACHPDAFGVSGFGDLFEGIPCDVGGNVVPISAHRGDGGSISDPRGSERVQIIPPNGRPSR